ncbi:flagella basal body P-ring formation protein FlgA [Qipengyuania qiaonensis]|uniref:Flagella basal body P-ring formation protein FlgA n=1 Tax=Qipengyuania qiaonensis TaxID=2867240 RepID=A0ABS7J3J0_9SPHN|nr:flagella basal body P-ring formation protein FlgA [Qipengyuania qiaonensis]MBX7481895.1 flagella basal body P-ring formation protein FlgA [Qipengyuania qiaonensis]
MRNIFLGTAAAALFATTAAAASPMEHSIIDRAVADFTGAAIGQPGGAKLPVDRRLRLASCQSPLDLQWFGRDQRSIQVACPREGWRIYVAVDGVANHAGQVPEQYGETIVKRGENVSILVRGRGFTLTRQGSAVEDGAQGEWIRIRASGERTETMRALVIRPGQVGIDLP